MGLLIDNHPCPSFLLDCCLFLSTLLLSLISSPSVFPSLPPFRIYEVLPGACAGTNGTQPCETAPAPRGSQWMHLEWTHGKRWDSTRTGLSGAWEQRDHLFLSAVQERLQRGNDPWEESGSILSPKSQTEQKRVFYQKALHGQTQKLNVVVRGVGKTFSGWSWSPGHGTPLVLQKIWESIHDILMWYF